MFVVMILILVVLVLILVTQFHLESKRSILARLNYFGLAMILASLESEHPVGSNERHEEATLYAQEMVVALQLPQN